jgi:hypothetical protein
MDERSLRAHFESAVATRPPTPYLVPNSLRAGRKLRRRRRIEAAAASVSTVVAVAILAPLLSGQFSAAGHDQAVGGIVRGQGIAYVSTTINATTSAVTPVRLSTGTALKAMRFGVVLQMAAASGGKAVYVFSTPRLYGADQVDYFTRINAATGKPGRPVRLHGGLQQIQFAEIAPGGRFAYAIESGTWPGSQDGTSALIAINLTTGAEHTLFNGATGFVMTPDGRMAYVYELRNAVVPVNLATGATMPPVKIQGNSLNLVITPDGRTAYVLSGSHGVDWLTPIDTATGAAGKPIQLPAGQVGTDIAVAPDGNTAYLSGGPSVIRISLASREVLKPIRLRPILGNYSYTFLIAPHAAIGYAVPLMKWVQPVNLITGAAASPVYLPGGYRTVTEMSPALDPSGDTAYVGATAYGPGDVREAAVIPIQISSGEPGAPIRVAGLPVQIVVAR